MTDDRWDREWTLRRKLIMEVRWVLYTLVPFLMVWDQVFDTKLAGTNLGIVIGGIIAMPVTYAAARTAVKLVGGKK